MPVARTIADNSYAMSLRQRLTVFVRRCQRIHPIIADFQAQRTRDAATGVTRHEQVVFAFVRIGVAHQAALGADRLELLEPAGQHFVRINLVSRVPDQAIAAEVEIQAQRDGQLDHAEIAGEMGRTDAQHAYQLVTDVLGTARAGRC